MSENALDPVDVLMPMLQDIQEEHAPPTLMRFNFDPEYAGDFFKLRDAFPKASDEEILATVKEAQSKGYLEAPVMGAPEIFNLTEQGHKEALLRKVHLEEGANSHAMVVTPEDNPAQALRRFVAGIVVTLCVLAALWIFLGDSPDFQGWLDRNFE